MKTNKRHALLCASAALLLLATAPVQAETDVAGVTAAVNPKATAFDGAGRPRLISLGDPVIRNHRIETSGEGLVQILLADGTSFTVGPNSSVVIDSFVYDPEKNTASLAATMTKGALRFIGGKASKASGNVKIDTPIGTAGIRGAVVDINLNGQTSDGQPLPPHMTLVYGKEVQLTGNGSPQRLFKQGFSIVAGDGQPRVQRTPPQWVSGLQQFLAGRPGQSGGASNTPTDQTVASSTVSQTNSAQLPSENTIPVPQPRPIVTTPVEDVAGESQRDVGTRPEVPTETEEPWDGSAQAVAMVDDDGDTDLGKFSGTLKTNASGQLTGTFGQLGTISLQKATASDTLTSSSVTGTVGSLGAVSGTAYTGSGEFIAYMLTANDGGDSVYIVGGKTADPSEVFSSSRVYRYSVEEDPINGSVEIGGVTVPFTSSFATGSAVASDIYVGGVTPEDNVAARLLQGSLSISGSGTDQTSSILVMAGSFKNNGSSYAMSGRVSGSSQTSDPTNPNGTSLYVETLGSGSGKNQLFGEDGEYLVLGTGDADDVVERSDLYGTVQVASRNDAGTTSTSRTLGDQTMTGFSSGAATNRWTQDTELFVGTVDLEFDDEAGTFTGSIIDDSSNYFADFLSSSEDSEQVYLTNQLIAAVDSSGEAYMVSSSVVPATIFNGSSSICSSCEFMTWGWWGKTLGMETSYTVHLGNWIIGKQPENSAMPSSGTATYTGNAVGTVVNGSAQYIATGAMTSTMDFGARTGTVSVSGYDSKNFSANVNFGSNSATFSGNITTGVTSGSVTGAFASNGIDPVKGIMGNFTATDGTWSSTGIFAGSTTGVSQ
jgi:hypothetical protein